MKKHFLVTLLVAGAITGQVQGAATGISQVPGLERDASISSLEAYLNFVEGENITPLLSEAQQVNRNWLNTAFRKLKEGSLEADGTAVLVANLEDFSNVVKDMLDKQAKTIRTVGTLSVNQQKEKAAAEKLASDFERLAREAKDALEGKKAPKKTPPSVAPKKSAAQVEAEKAELARQQTELKRAQEAEARKIAEEQKKAEVLRQEQLRVEQERAVELEKLAQLERQRLAKVEAERVAAERLVIEQMQKQQTIQEAAAIKARRLEAVQQAQANRFKGLYLSCANCPNAKNQEDCQAFKKDSFNRMSLRFENGDLYSKDQTIGAYVSNYYYSYDFANAKYPLDFADTFYLWKAGFGASSDPVDVVATDGEFSPLFRLLYDCARGFYEDPELIKWPAVVERKTAYFKAAGITNRQEKLQSWAEKLPLLIGELSKIKKTFFSISGNNTLIFNHNSLIQKSFGDSEVQSAIHYAIGGELARYFKTSGTAYEKEMFDNRSSNIYLYMAILNRESLGMTVIGKAALAGIDAAEELERAQQSGVQAGQVQQQKALQAEQVRQMQIVAAEKAQQQALKAKKEQEKTRLAFEAMIRQAEDKQLLADAEREEMELLEQEEREAEIKLRADAEREEAELLEQEEREAEIKLAEQMIVPQAIEGVTLMDRVRANIVEKLDIAAAVGVQEQALVVQDIPGFSDLSPAQKYLLTPSWWPEESPFYSIALIATQQVINYVQGIESGKLGDPKFDGEMLVSDHFKEMLELMVNAKQIAPLTLSDKVNKEIQSAINAIVQLNKNFRAATVGGAQANDVLLDFGDHHQIGRGAAMAEVLQLAPGNHDQQTISFIREFVRYYQMLLGERTDAEPILRQELITALRANQQLRSLGWAEFEKILTSLNLRPIIIDWEIVQFDEKRRANIFDVFEDLVKGK